MFCAKIWLLKTSIRIVKYESQIEPCTNVCSCYKLPGISGNLVVKSKLPPWSDSSLEAVEPHP